MQIMRIKLPDYQVDSEPNHRKIGKKFDDEIKKQFLGDTIVVRAISSSQHDILADDLIKIITKTGTDRYDKSRIGDRYENIESRKIDFFAFRRKITPRTELFKDISWGFYHGAKAVHGKPVRVDIIIIYDAEQVKSVFHHYKGRKEGKRDGFVFKNVINKQDTIKAIFYIS